MPTLHMVEVTLLAVVAGLFALQVALVVYAGLRRDGGSGDDDGPVGADAGGPPGGPTGNAVARGRIDARDPAEARDRRTDTPPGTVRCLACGAANDDAYRFCRLCVSQLPAGGDEPVSVAAVRGSAR